MAEHAQTVAGNAPGPVPSSGGLVTMLPLIGTLVLMPALAWAMTTFILIPKLQKSLNAAPAKAEHVQEVPIEHGGKSPEPEHSPKGGSKESVTMTKLLVNVSGTMGSRYLITSLTLSGAADFRTKMEKNEAKLRDMACTILATKTISELEKPGARGLVRSELLTGFNNILGANSVQEIYITEFAIQ